MTQGTAGVRLPRIVWVVRDRSTDYGMLGSIKAFSIHVDGSRYRLNPRLPDRKGMTPLPEEFSTKEAAKGRAEEIRAEWRTALETPYEGRLKRTS